MPYERRYKLSCETVITYKIQVPQPDHRQADHTPSPGRPNRPTGLISTLVTSNAFPTLLSET